MTLRLKCEYGSCFCSQECFVPIRKRQGVEGSSLDLFSGGQWAQLIARSSQISPEVVSISTRRGRREVGSDLECWVARDEQLAALGELSVGRQALEGAAIAPANMRTLAALTDPNKRPREPRGPLDEDLLPQPVVPYTMDMKTFLRNVRSSRNGVAPRPCHSQLFYEVAVEVSRGNAPDVFRDAFRRSYPHFTKPHLAKTALGQKKYEFGQFVSVTHIGQTEFGQN